MAPFVSNTESPISSPTFVQRLLLNLTPVLPSVGIDEVGEGPAYTSITLSWNKRVDS